MGKVNHPNTMSPQYIFSRAANLAKTMPSTIKPSPQAELRLYAFLKQGTEGDNVIPQPAETDAAEKAKWDMWKAMEGLSQETARSEYVRNLRSVLYTSDSPDAKKVLAELHAVIASGVAKQS